MGDRCSVDLYILGEGIEKFKTITGWGEPNEGPELYWWSGREIEIQNNRLYNCVWEEVNYGGIYEMKEAAKAGCRFHGSYGDGGGYGAWFVCSGSLLQNEPLAMTPMGKDSADLIVTVDWEPGTEPTINEADMARLRRYIAAREILAAMTE